MTNPSKAYADRAILSNAEVSEMLNKADDIENEYFKLRVKAVIGIVRIFGKRRAEIASLTVADLETKDHYLYVTFNIRKKHKKGLFQYIKSLEAQIKKGLMEKAELDSKTHIQLQTEWQEWTQTKDGYRIKEEKVTKKTPIDTPLCSAIMEYYEYLKQENPKGKWLFPSGISVFGESYIMRNENHLSGRQLLRLIKPLNASAWLHLFRETKGANIARDGGRNLNTLYEVRDTLDLENEETAYRYIRRYAVQEVRTQ
jgi:integrase